MTTATPSSNSRIDLLDILRGLAIFLVICHHYRHFAGAPQWFRWFGLRGYIGVDIFFVLSGWLIGGQIFREVAQTGTLAIGRFWGRRWFRTVPVYLAFLAFELWRNPALSDQLWKYLIFAQNYLDPMGWLITWSLCIEEHFYLVLPLVIIVAIKLFKLQSRRLAIVFGILAMISVALRWQQFPLLHGQGYNNFLANFYVPTHLRMDGLLIGVGLAAIRQWKLAPWRWVQKQPWVPLALGLFIFAISAWWPGLVGTGVRSSERLLFFNAVWQFLGVGLGTGLMIIGGVALHERGVSLKIPGSLWLAEHAYVLYLCHLIPPAWVAKGQPFWLGFVYSVAASMLIAVVLRQLVELPGLRLRNRVLSVG